MNVTPQDNQLNPHLERSLPKLFSAVLTDGIRKATKFIAPNLVVKATRRHKPDKRERLKEIVVTIGRPNYAEREFIRSCRKAGEPFPVRKLQLQPYR